MYLTGSRDAFHGLSDRPDTALRSQLALPHESDVGLSRYDYFDY